MTTTLDHTAVHLLRSRELCAQLPPLFAEASALVRRSRELCLVRRRVSGGSDLDSPALVEILATGWMCLECLARKTGVSVARTDEAIGRLGGFMKVMVDTGRCPACLQTATIYGVTNGGPASPGSEQRRTAETRNLAVWRFLESRRGDMFCSQCIAGALRATKRIDRAIFSAEGRGARRLHGPCTACGRERLLCGLAR
jgi:hypothetical protein